MTLVWQPYLLIGGQVMAATIHPATSLNDPDIIFTEDIMVDAGVAPQIFDDPRTPNLRIYARGKAQATRTS